MAPKINNSAMALFLALNLLFFSMASATCGGGCPTPIPTPRSPSIPNPTPTTPQPTPTTPRSPSIPNPTPTTPQPTPPTPSTPQPTPTTPSTPNIPNPIPTTPNPTPTTPTTPSTGGGMCPIDALRLGVCADVLRSLLNLNIGNPPVQPCCSLINGLVDLDAAVCLCTAIRANILGINLNVPLSLSLLLNACNQNAPSGFQCP